MLSIEDIKIKTKAQNYAKKMFKEGKNCPDNLKSKFSTFDKVDFFSDFSFNTSRVLIYEYVSILIKKYKVEFTKLETIKSDKIKGGYIHTYTYRLQDGQEFNTLLISKSSYPPSPSFSLADSLVQSKIESGCPNCGFSKEGCSSCCMNKIRKFLNDGNYPTFKVTGKPFLDLIEKYNEPLNNIIDYTIEEEKNHTADNISFGHFDEVVDEGTEEE